VLLLKRYLICDATFLGSCFETDYASFIAWRHWNCPDPTVYNFFAAAALRAADGGYLVGEMAPYTAGAGRLYFPAGTPDPSDVDARGAFDPIDHLSRELREETGISIDELDAEPGWVLVRDRCTVALIRRLVSRENADDLRRRAMRHITDERQPELSDIRIVRGPAQLDARMPTFVKAFLQEQWRQSTDK
jgi:8-oxo-dGTP pyrophosphatase MutT (NUDIX family)